MTARPRNEIVTLRRLTFTIIHFYCNSNNTKPSLLCFALLQLKVVVVVAAVVARCISFAEYYEILLVGWVSFGCVLFIISLLCLRHSSFLLLQPE